MISGSSSLGSFTGVKAHEFVAHASKTNCVAIGPRSGQVLATGGDDKRVNVWRIGRASSIWSLTGNSSAIESLRFDPTEGFLVSGSAGGAVKLFDLSAGKMTRHFRGHMSNVTVIDCGSFDRRFVTTGSMDCQVKLWNVETKECAMAFKGHNAEVTDVQFSPDGYILASAAADGQVKLWDLRAGKPMHTFQACSGPVRAIRFNPQEFLLAAATSDRTVKLYDIEFMELFCTTAPDTCPIRAISFDPEGQIMYCASPSGLRRWSWDNDTASARLEAMGDVPWGKVCAGALHYNADGRQLLAASCAGSRVSVWAVDFDERASLPSRPQQQEETGSASEPGAAAVALALSGTTPTEELASVTAATSKPGTPAGGATSIAMIPADSSTSPGGYKSTDAKISSSRLSGKTRSEEIANREEHSHDRGSKQVTELKQSGEEPTSAGISGSPTFQVLGRQLPLLPTAAEEKEHPPRPISSAAANVRATSPSVTAGGAGPISQAAVTVASLSTVAPSTRGGGSGGAFRNRRSSRAEAVAAAVAAVASAKAATDDAVASVSSSGRHRSIGTSISDTLVITAHPGDGACGAGAAGATVDGPDDRVGSSSHGGKQHRSVVAAWAEQAPGKEGGSRGVDRGRGVAAALGVIAAGDRRRLGGERHTAGSNNDGEHKWHKRVTGAFAVAEEAVGDIKQGDRRFDSGDDGGGRDGVSNSRGMGMAEDKEAKSPTRRDDKAPTSETADCSGATPLFTVNPWSQGPRNGGKEEARKEARGGGGGGDSPPLLGSPETSPVAAVATATVPATLAAAVDVTRAAASASSPLRDNSNPPFLPSTSRRSPGISGQRETADAIVARSSAVGFPVAVGDADGSSHNDIAASQDCTPAQEIHKHEAGGAAAAEGLNVADIFPERGGGELGMTRPRTATRRWDRPGPPGDDEVITKTLLSRAAVTSTLSNRLTHLRMLRCGWADGDISGTISRLARLESSVTAADDSPRAVVADFLWVVPLDGARVTLEHCLDLMPLLEGFWKLDADSCVAAATRCLESIVRRFGGFVRDTLGAPVAAGRVDLAREDRIARCREAHRAFIRGYHHLERSEGEFYEDRRIAAVAERLRPLFESYFMSS